MGVQKEEFKKILATKVSQNLLEEIDAAIRDGKFVTYSEYIRSALREKLERDKK